MRSMSFLRRRPPLSGSKLPKVLLPRLRDFFLEGKARIWSRLSSMCHCFSAKISGSSSAWEFGAQATPLSGSKLPKVVNTSLLCPVLYCPLFLSLSLLLSLYLTHTLSLSLCFSLSLAHTLSPSFYSLHCDLWAVCQLTDGRSREKVNDGN